MKDIERAIVPSFNTLSSGDEVVRVVKQPITKLQLVRYAGASGDFNPLHTDEEFMKNGPFKGRIAHGMLLASVATGQANQLGIFEGTSLAVLSITLKFTNAVRFGDTVRTVLTCKEKKESSKPDKGTATFDVRMLNQRNETVMESQWVVLLKRAAKQ